MKHFTRREFIQNGAAISTVLNLQLANYAAADSMGTGDDRKALVCIFFGGGLDAYHVLVPRDDDRYADYQASRTNLAHRKDALLPLTEIGDSGGALYGLHPRCQQLADMFNGEGSFAGKRSASWVSNVGSLIKPLTMAEFRAGTPGFDIPVGLGGHARQSEQWQTVLPQGTVNLKGWLGRTADLLHSAYNRDKTSMNISLSGNNTIQLGNEARPLAYSPTASLGLTGDQVTDPSDPLSLKNLMHRRILGQDLDNFVERSFSEISTFSLDQQLQLTDAITNFDKRRFIASYPRTAFGLALEAITILIASREELGLCRQTFFIPATGGWDDHFELGLNFDDRIASVSEGISIFQRNLDHLGLRESVLGFTSSEFARTLRSSGAGSDHAWAGPQMVFGGPIEPGKIFGRFPNLALDGPDDTGRGGRILADRSCDEYFADMLDLVLPNYDNFRISGREPIGYIGT